MRKALKESLSCYEFPLLDKFSGDVDHAVFTRWGGVSTGPYESLNVRYGIGDEESHVVENRRRILQAMNIDRCISANQTHSKNVLPIDAEMVKNLFLEGGTFHEVEDFDGFVTDVRGIGLMLQVADCQNILFYDPGKRVLGLAHAGWKGLKQNISGEMIGMMKERFGCSADRILVAIGPSLGPESAEFTDPYAELGAEFDPFIDDRKVDLWRFSYWQLMHLGISEDNIEICHTDTVKSKEFFSYRRDNKITGRLAMMAYLK